MPLNIISNFAAQVAHRNLTMSDKGASSSVAKISAGTRVLGARDDAAALAIGSRLRSEVAAMTQASVNAGQAVSMLQIADGAMSQINDTLVRMKSLAVQAGSDQLGSVERGLINTEFQQLLGEIQRISEDTEFNGQALINGGVLSELVKAFDPSVDGVANIGFDNSVADGDIFQYAYNGTNEVLTVTKLGVENSFENSPADVVTDGAAANNISFTFDESVASDAVFEYSYDQTTEQFTVTNVTTNDTVTMDITSAFDNAFGAATAVPTGESFDIDFGSLGVTVTLTEGFDTTAALTVTEATAANAGAEFTVTGGNATGDVLTVQSGLSDAALTALNALLTNGGVTLDVTAAGNATVEFDADANWAFGIDGAASAGVGNASGDIVGSNTVELYIDVGGTLTQVATLDTSGVAHAADGASSLALDLNNVVLNQQGSGAASDQVVQLDLTDSLDAVAGTGQNLGFGQTLDVDVAQFGVSLTLDSSFDRTSDITTTTGAIGTPLPTGVTNASFTENATRLTGDVYQALLDLGYNSTTGVGYNSTTGVLSLQVNDDNATYELVGLAGLNYGLGDGTNTADLAGTTADIDIDITMADGSVVELGNLAADFAAVNNEGLATIDIQLGKGVFFNEVNEDALTNDFTFKIGTGNESFDRITLSLNSVNQEALGINGLDTTTATNADAASTAISSAIDVLNTARANVGAFQNRLDIAASNLATARENTEAARSALLDLDVAAEMTAFTSQQILVQAGVSMLAQANQLPQNLLRLLQ